MAGRYWFRPKTYGYGATPITWEGWAVTIGVALLVAGSILLMKGLVDRGNVVAWLVWAAVVAGVVLGFVRFSRARTDGEWRWRWGRRTKAKFGG
jgi:VIT1/CCC1 family predicted Fe2+/Mn2+ transporter